MKSVLYKYLAERVPRKIGDKIRKDGEHYLSMSTIMGTFISLNNMAGEIYLKCDGKKTIGNLVEEVCQQYRNMDDEKIKEDVCRCIADLESVNMISVVK